MSGWYPDFGKRVLDILGAGVALVVLSPLLILVWCAIRLEDGGAALFVQERISRGGMRFRLIKFRSMPINTANVPSAAGSSLKVTRVGRFIRRINIDELPQLWNILRGDMSIVGPRPALPDQENLLGLRSENGATACRPGLTGMAQIKSYDGMPESEKASLDGQYASRISFLLDSLIILRTFSYLLRRPPVY